MAPVMIEQTKMMCTKEDVKAADEKSEEQREKDENERVKKFKFK